MSTRLDLGDTPTYEFQGGSRKSKKKLKLPSPAPFKYYSFANKIPHPAEIFTFNEYPSEFLFPQNLLQQKQFSYVEIQDFLFEANKALGVYWKKGNKLVKLNKIPVYGLLAGLVMIVFSFESISLVIFGILVEFLAALGLYFLLYKRLQFEKYILEGEAKIKLAELCQEWNVKKMVTKGLKLRPGPLCAWIEFWNYRGQRLQFIEDRMQQQKDTNDESEQQRLALEILDEVKKFAKGRIFSKVSLLFRSNQIQQRKWNQRQNLLQWLSQNLYDLI